MSDEQDFYVMFRSEIAILLIYLHQVVIDMSLMRQSVKIRPQIGSCGDGDFLGTVI